MKTWPIMLKDELSWMSGPNTFVLRRKNMEWLSLVVALTQDRKALVVAMGNGAVRPC